MFYYQEKSQNSCMYSILNSLFHKSSINGSESLGIHISHTIQYLWNCSFIHYQKCIWQIISFSSDAVSTTQKTLLQCPLVKPGNKWRHRTALSSHRRTSRRPCLLIRKSDFFFLDIKMALPFCAAEISNVGDITGFVKALQDALGKKKKKVSSCMHNRTHHGAMR